MRVYKPTVHILRFRWYLRNSIVNFIHVYFITHFPSEALNFCSEAISKTLALRTNNQNWTTSRQTAWELVYCYHEQGRFHQNCNHMSVAVWHLPTMFCFWTIMHISISIFKFAGQLLYHYFSTYRSVFPKSVEHLSRVLQHRNHSSLDSKCWTGIYAWSQKIKQGQSGISCRLFRHGHYY